MTENSTLTDLNIGSESWRVQSEGTPEGMAACRALCCNQFAHLLSIFWFSFPLVSALVFTWQANSGSRIYSFSVKGNFLPEVIEKISCVLLFLAGSHAQNLLLVGEKQSLMMFVNPALELGMVSSSLEGDKDKE